MKHGKFSRKISVAIRRESSTSSGDPARRVATAIRGTPHTSLKQAVKKHSDFSRKVGAALRSKPRTRRRWL